MLNNLVLTLISVGEVKMRRRWLLEIVGLIMAFLIGIVVGATIVGIVNIRYTIKPSSTEAVTLSPNPIVLDLGNISTKSHGIVDFGNTSRLSLSEGYELNFSLDLSSVEPFETFEVTFTTCKAGTTTTYYWFSLDNGYLDDRSHIWDAGNYDVYIEVEYLAKDLAETTSGQAVITVYY
jgi:hypothetical protein